MQTSKIEQQKALDIIKQKYPKADFWIDEETQTYNIAFEGPDSKVYSYKCFNTLCFLQRLKLIDENVMYKKDYNLYEKSYNKVLQKIENIKNDVEEYYFMTKEEALQLAQKELNRLKEILDKSIILDI